MAVQTSWSITCKISGSGQMLPILSRDRWDLKSFRTQRPPVKFYLQATPCVSGPNQPATQSFVGKTLLYRINTHYMYINIRCIWGWLQLSQLPVVASDCHDPQAFTRSHLQVPRLSNKQNNFLKWPPFFNRTKHTQHISGIYPLQNWRNNKNRGMFPLQNFNVGHQPLEIICAKQPVKLLTPLFDSLEAERAALEREKLRQAPWKRKKLGGWENLDCENGSHNILP